MVRAAVGLLALVLTVGVAGCSSQDGEKPAGTPAPSAIPSPLKAVDTTAITVGRAPFCDRISPDSVLDALGGKAAEPDSWVSGDRIAVGGGDPDVVHEFGCSWPASADDGRASAWVFAPPVTPEKAAGMQKAALNGPGCEEVPDASAYGEDSIATRCRRGADSFVGYRGRFADAWLDCRLTPASPDDLTSPEFLERADLWCSAVLSAAT